MTEPHWLNRVNDRIERRIAFDGQKQQTAWRISQANVELSSLHEPELEKTFRACKRLALQLEVALEHVNTLVEIARDAQVPPRSRADLDR